MARRALALAFGDDNILAGVSGGPTLDNGWWWDYSREHWGEYSVDAFFLSIVCSLVFLLITYRTLSSQR